MVTIVGGGIAGTVLAGALAAEGIPVRVYESQQYVGAGAFLVLDDRAHAALIALGVSADRLDEVAHPVDALRVEYQPAEERFGPSRGHRLYLRGELMAVLTEFATATAAEFHYDTAVTDIDEGVLLSGATRLPTDDIVIAADGIDSLARQRIEPERVPRVCGSGRLLRPHRAATSIAHQEHGAALRRPDRRRRSADRRVRPLLGRNDFRLVRQGHSPGPSPGRPRIPSGGAVGRTHSHPCPGNLRRRRSLARADADVHVSNARHVPFTAAAPPRLPLILCGDADHAITPAEGVGARDAIEDAAAIFRALTAGSSPAEAMAARRRQIAADRERVVPPYRRAGN
ncbi:FAD-dependent oxidoreductase [Nocardia barduliensis]|uniref:FAD-dependent oxidoreductase n=1 Tax=Nocardia barduliensis TaxID=2736643 RepID=UPI0015725A4D|nr:NAD(P)-binding protein [Nocardia barduliensis]